MSNAWFSADAAYYFSAAAILGLTALAAPMIIKGRYRTPIVSLWSGIILAGLGLFAAGLAAWGDGQPSHVTLPLMLTGGAMAAAYGFSILFVLKAYRMAEQRKLAAREL